MTKTHIVGMPVDTDTVAEVDRGTGYSAAIRAQQELVDALARLVLEAVEAEATTAASQSSRTYGRGHVQARIGTGQLGGKTA